MCFCFKTAEEINERLNGLKVEEPLHLRNDTFRDINDSSLPTSVDWRTSGLVGPVRNQVLNELLKGDQQKLL